VLCDYRTSIDDYLLDMYSRKNETRVQRKLRELKDKEIEAL